MTEQQIKRIQEAVNMPNTAIQCETEEEANMLFEAMGWKWRNCETYELHEANYGRELCYALCGKFWVYCDRDWYLKHGKEIIPFSALLSPKSSGLVEALGLEHERKYQYNQTVFWFTEKQFHVETGGSFGIGSVALLIEIFNNPHKIRPVRVWSDKEKDIAAAAIKMGFETVFKAQAGNLDFGWHDNIGTFRAHKLEGEMPELKPGECVALADIAGG